MKTYALFVTFVTLMYSGSIWAQIAAPRPNSVQLDQFRCPVSRLTSTASVDIQNLINTQRANLTSAEMFIDCLPDAFMRYGQNTLMIKSQSPEASDTSVRYPRALLFAPGVFLSFTGDPHGVHFNEARMIVANDRVQPRKFEFSTITFDEQGATVHPQTHNECVRCHEGHLIWKPYRQWDGTFAPTSDLQWTKADATGYFQFVNFIQLNQNSPRYGRIVRAIEGDQGQIAANQLIPDQPNFHPRQPYAPANGDMLTLIQKEHARWVQSRLRNSKAYQTTKYLMAAVYLQCKLPTPIESQLESNLSAVFGTALVNKEYVGFELTDVHRKFHGLAMMGQIMGLSPQLWSTDFQPGTDPETLEAPGMDLGGGRYMIDFTFEELLKDLIAEQPALAAGFPAARWADPYYSYMDVHFHDRIPAPFKRGFNDECAALLPSVEREFAQNQGLSALGSAELAPSRIMSFKNQCVGCHHAGNTEGAPEIPFENQSAFETWKQNYDGQHGSGAARARILYKLNNRLMPKDRLISPAERAILIQMLDSH